jgi:hypothetical protein
METVVDSAEPRAHFVTAVLTTSGLAVCTIALPAEQLRVGDTIVLERTDVGWTFRHGAAGAHAPLRVFAYTMHMEHEGETWQRNRRTT